MPCSRSKLNNSSSHSILSSATPSPWSQNNDKSHNIAVSEIKDTATETSTALEQISGDVGNKRTTLDTTVCLCVCVCVLSSGSFRSYQRQSVRYD